jgi:hypothetical protein
MSYIRLGINIVINIATFSTLLGRIDSEEQLTLVLSKDMIPDVPKFSDGTG